jgi:hypothetical protein
MPESPPGGWRMIERHGEYNEMKMGKREGGWRCK